MRCLLSLKSATSFRLLKLLPLTSAAQVRFLEWEHLTQLLALGLRQENGMSKLFWKGFHVF